jgi:hypothetical protein
MEDVNSTSQLYQETDADFGKEGRPEILPF